MSATILAAKIVSEWDELSTDSPVNRETYIRNLLIAFQIHVASETIADITKDAKRRAAIVTNYKP